MLKANAIQIDRVHVTFRGNVAAHRNHFVNHQTLLFQIHVKGDVEVRWLQEKIRRILRHIGTRTKNSCSASNLSTIGPLMHFRTSIGVIDQVRISVVRLVTCAASMSAAVTSVRHLFVLVLRGDFVDVSRPPVRYFRYVEHRNGTRSFPFASMWPNDGDEGRRGTDAFTFREVHSYCATPLTPAVLYRYEDPSLLNPQIHIQSRGERQDYKRPCNRLA